MPILAQSIVLKVTPTYLLKVSREVKKQYFRSESFLEEKKVSCVIRLQRAIYQDSYNKI